MIKRIQNGSIRFFFWALLLLAISISGLRFALAELNFFKTEIETQLSQELGGKISIERINGVLNGFKPELALYNIRVHSGQKDETALQLKEIRLGLNLLNVLQQPIIEAIQISLISAKLSVKRLKSGNITIQGLPNSGDEQQPTWLMQGSQYKLIDSDINWHDEKRNAQPVQLKHVNISIANTEQHKISISTDLPEAFGQSLKLTMNFTGNMFAPDSVNAKLFVQGKGIKLAKFITGDLPFDFSFTKGHGDFSIWSTWKAAQMTEMSGTVTLNDAVISSKENTDFPVDQLALQFKLQKQQQWQIALQNTTIKSQHIDLNIAALALGIELNEQGAISQIALNCPQLDLFHLSNSPALNKILPEEMQAFTLKGQLKNLLFFANLPQKTFAINGYLNQIHTNAVGQIPGIGGLSVFINGTKKQGELQLFSRHMTFDSPQQFRAPLLFNHVLGELHWQQQADDWILSSPMLELNTTHIKTKNNLHLSLKSDSQASSLSLQSAFFDGRDATQIHHYLPVAIIDDEALLSWLDLAFLAGTIDQGGVLFHGALNDFPFTESQGVFEVLFHAAQVDLNYANNWPAVEDLDAEVRFFSESLEVNIFEGLANQAAIKHAVIKIGSFSDSDTLSILGNIEGNLSQANDFLLLSPLKEQISTVNQLVAMQGLFTADLNLTIPLIDDLPASSYISVNVQDAQLNIIPADLLIEHINADMHFTEEKIYSDNLTGYTLGYPVEATIDSKDESTRVFLSGQTDIEHLTTQLKRNFQPYLSGNSNYQIRLNVPKDTSKSTKLQLITDLEGLNIDFPPFSKPAHQIHPFSLDLSIAPSGIEAVSLNYENRLSPNDRLDINMQKILPHWQGLIHSPILTGSIFIPSEFNNKSTMSFQLKKLDLTALQTINLQGDNNSFSVLDLPSINMESKAIYWQNHNLGQLKLSTEPSADGLLINQLNITSATDELDLSGYWQQSNSRNKTLINGTLLSEDLGYLLQRMQLSENILGATADIQFSINWPGSPDKITRQKITGTVISYLSNGRILGVEPGLGRILGALDIWKLFKRLRLDFSDITEEGLSFSEIVADVSINQGVASSKKFNIDAMPAEINITGTTNLNTREVDILATVLPKFPIAGTIIGNVANAVTKTFISDNHSGGLLLSLLYEIKGTWEQFTVNRQFSSALADITIEAPITNKKTATSQ